MTKEPQSEKKSSAAAAQNDRLKAALKANMGRRKAQAKARAEDDADDDHCEKPGEATTADKDKG